MTHPGADAGTTTNVSWHADGSKCTLWVTKQGDINFCNASEYILEGKLSTVEEYYDRPSGRYYVYKMTLSDLTPDTEYIFKIKERDDYYTGYSFRTAPVNKEFSFGWLADVHLDPVESKKPERVDYLTGLMKEKLGTNPYFIAFTGDLVKWGNMYASWQEFRKSEAFKTHSLIYTPGNKEYYKLKNWEQDDSVLYYSPEWFLDCTNLPDNGPEGIEGTYYCLYDRLLFITINSNKEEHANNKVPNHTDVTIPKQREWFEKVIADNKGKFDYIIVQTHYAFFTHEEDTTDVCRWGNYNIWKDLFDKYSVDFAIAGDYHEYVRTNPVFKDGLAKENGTIYLTYAQVAERTDILELKESDKDPLLAKYSIGSATAFGTFTVNDKEILFKYYDYAGKLIDSVSCPKKTR